MTEIIKQLDLFKQYQKFKIEIIASDPKRWCLSSAKYELPTFEYYLENCIKNKGGKYDFTIRRYKTHLESLPKINSVLYDKLFEKQKNITRKIEFSIWMGTPFNFNEKISIN